MSCGSGGRERALGGFGDDIVSCLDGARGDTVSGGAGTADLCIGDIGDSFVGCERILRVSLPL